MPSIIIRSVLGLLVLVSQGGRPGFGDEPSGQSSAAGKAASLETRSLPEEPGAFARLCNERNLVRPGILSPSQPGELHAVSLYRLPADFEPIEAVLVVADRFERKHPDLLRRLAAQVAPRAKLWLVVANEQGRTAVERLLTPLRLDDRQLRFIQAPTDTIWMRDFGPVFISDAKGRRSVVDLEYSLPKRENDNAVTASVARQTATPLVRLPFLLEGGNLLSNGQGLCVVTTLALNRNISRGYEPAEVVDGLGSSFGVEQLVVLEPLWDESTGHIDMFACFTAPDTIVVGSGSPTSDPANAAILDRNAALLARVRLDTGPLRVVRVPMPGHEDGVWRTYTNGIFVNRLYLMPTYAGSEPSSQVAATKTFRALLPGWDVVGLDVDPLIKEGGALRCISLQVPYEKTP